MNKNEAKNVKVGDFLVTKKTDILGEVVKAERQDNGGFIFSLKDEYGNIAEFKNADVAFTDRVIEKKDGSAFVEDTLQDETKIEHTSQKKADDSIETKSTDGSKKRVRSINHLYKEIKTDVMTQDEYNKLKYASKSNINKENSFVIEFTEHKDGDEFDFIAGTVGESTGYGIKAKNTNTAKKIFNRILSEM